MRKFYKANDEGAGGELDATAIVLKAIDGIKKEVGEAAKVADVTKAVNDATEPLKAQLEAIKVKQDESDRQVKAIDEKAGRIQVQGESKEDRSFGAVFAKAAKDNFDAIKEVNASQKIGFELKTVGNMTVAGNLTGAAVQTFGPSPALVPSQKVNFRSLVSGIQSATGIWSFYRETGTEGSISLQSTPGVAKTQIDYDLTRVDYTARYLAGFAKIDRSMLQDLPFLQSALPGMLLRDFYKAENAKFYTDLTSVATGSTVTGGTNEVEKLIDYITNLLDTDYSPNAIVTNAGLWGKILKTKPSDYSIPGGVTIDANGNVRILGMPLMPASWVPANKAIIGDWDYAKRVEVDGLKVQFFEQDDKNVQENLITVRIECREVLAVERTQAFVFADLS